MSLKLDADLNREYIEECLGKLTDYRGVLTDPRRDFVQLKNLVWCMRNLPPGESHFKDTIERIEMALLQIQ